MQKAGVCKTSGRWPTFPGRADGARLALGVETLDAALGGGLDRRRLHEIVPGSPFHLGAAAGFAGALAAMNGHGGIVWIQQRMAGLEGASPVLRPPAT